jgi:hypothetical protein
MGDNGVRLSRYAMSSHSRMLALFLSFSLRCAGNLFFTEDPRRWRLGFIACPRCERDLMDGSGLLWFFSPLWNEVER